MDCMDTLVCVHRRCFLLIFTSVTFSLQPPEMEEEARYDISVLDKTNLMSCNSLVSTMENINWITHKRKTENLHRSMRFCEMSFFSELVLSPYSSSSSLGTTASWKFWPSQQKTSIYFCPGFIQASFLYSVPLYSLILIQKLNILVMAHIFVYIST